jgi:hypothetical protein
MAFGIKINTTDVLFSKLVRERDGHKCVRCGRKHEEYKNTLDCSHFWGRGSKSVRWDMENADSLCRYPCHQGSNSSHPGQFGWEYQKQIKGHNGCPDDGEYTKFKIKQLGQNNFDLLMIRAHTPTKVDEKMLRIVFKAALKQAEKAKKLGLGDILGAR